MAKKEMFHKANLVSIEAFLNDCMKKKQQEIDKLKGQQSNQQHSTELTEALLGAAIQALENQKDEIKLCLRLLKLLAKKNVSNKKPKKLTFSMKKKVKLAFLDKPRRFLEENESSDIEDRSLKGVLFYTRTFDNIQGLNRKMKELIFGVKEIHGLEAKMIAVLVKSEEEINFEFKVRKSFYQWLIEFNRSDYEWDILNAFKAVAAYHGVKLTHLLLDFMHLASDSETLNKIRVLKSALKWVIEGEKSVVIERILAVLDWVDSETEFEELEEDITDKTILLFLNIIIRMEFFWMHRGLPCRKRSISSEYRAMEYELDKCLSVLTAIESDIRDMKELSAFDFEGEDQDFKVKNQSLNIDELWDDIED